MTEEVEEIVQTLTWDHKQIYLKGKPFTPLIYEREGEPPKGFNTAQVRLPAHLHDDLSWEKEILLARNLVKKGYLILWHLDFGLPDIVWEDEPSFLALKIGAEQFKKRIFPEFEEASLGILLYKGGLDIREKFQWTSKQQENWERSEGKDKRLFCLDTFAYYLHLLAPHLPDSLPLLLALDGREIPPEELFLLLHKDRFEHFLIALKASIPFPALSWGEGTPSLGYLGETLFLPPKEEAKVGILYAPGIEEILAKLQGIPYRILYENFATEEWDGLEAILVPGKEISSKAKRILLGFQAAGGAISWEEYRGRGI